MRINVPSILYHRGTWKTILEMIISETSSEMTQHAIENSVAHVISYECIVRDLYMLLEEGDINMFPLSGIISAAKRKNCSVKNWKGLQMDGPISVLYIVTPVVNSPIAIPPIYNAHDVIIILCSFSPVLC